MYKTCHSKPAIARQRKIEAGLLEYIAHKPYEELSVSDLCQYIGIPRKAFYRYFSNKDGALYALIDHKLTDFLDQYIDIIKASGGIQTTMVHFFSFWKNEKKLLDALASNNLSGILLQRAISFTMGRPDIVEIISSSQGSAPAKRYRTTFIISGVISLIIQWHHNRFDKTPEQMAEIASSLLPKPY